MRFRSGHAVCSGLRVGGPQGPHAALRDRGRRASSAGSSPSATSPMARCGRRGSVTGWPARPPAGGGDRRAGAGPGPRFRPGAAASGRGDGAAGERGEPRGAGKGRLPRGGAAASATWTSTGPGATTCWWPSRSRSSPVRRARRWSATATPAGPDFRLPGRSGDCAFSDATRRRCLQNRTLTRFSGIRGP